jgi:hypothetical protein
MKKRIMTNWIEELETKFTNLDVEIYYTLPPVVEELEEEINKWIKEAKKQINSIPSDREICSIYVNVDFHPLENNIHIFVGIRSKNNKFNQRLPIQNISVYSLPNLNLAAYLHAEFGDGRLAEYSVLYLNKEDAQSDIKEAIQKLEGELL